MRLRAGRYGRVPRALDAFVRLLAPFRCVGCDTVCTEPFCAACAILVEPLHEPSESKSAAFVYGGPLAQAVTPLKYRRRSEIAVPPGPPFAHAAPEHAGTLPFRGAPPPPPARPRER